MRSLSVIFLILTMLLSGKSALPYVQASLFGIMVDSHHEKGDHHSSITVDETGRFHLQHRHADTEHSNGRSGESSHHEHSLSCSIFPVFDMSARLSLLAVRLIDGFQIPQPAFKLTRYVNFFVFDFLRPPIS